MEINSDKEYLRHVDTSATTTDMFDHLINQYGHIKGQTENRLNRSSKMACLDLSLHPKKSNIVISKHFWLNAW